VVCPVAAVELKRVVTDSVNGNDRGEGI